MLDFVNCLEVAVFRHIHDIEFLLHSGVRYEVHPYQFLPISLQRLPGSVESKLILGHTLYRDLVTRILVWPAIPKDAI